MIPHILHKAQRISYEQKRIVYISVYKNQWRVTLVAKPKLIATVLGKIVVRVASYR